MTIFRNVENFAESELASGITSGATSLDVQAGHGSLFPEPPFLCVLDESNGAKLEVVLVTAKSTDTFTVTRAQEGSTAQAFSTGAKVELRWTKGQIEIIHDHILGKLNQWGQVPLDNWRDAVTGTGATSFLTRRKRIETGATAFSTARSAIDNEGHWSQGLNRSIINWNKYIVFSVPVSLLSVTTNGQVWLYWGSEYDDTVGDPDSSGIGFRIDDQALKGITHNGTSLDAVDLSTTIATFTTYVLTTVSDGSGNVEWFVNDSSVGTSTGGPTGGSDFGHDSIRFLAANNADSSLVRAQIADLKYYVEK